MYSYKYIGLLCWVMALIIACDPEDNSPPVGSNSARENPPPSCKLGENKPPQTEDGQYLLTFITDAQCNSYLYQKVESGTAAPKPPDPSLGTYYKANRELQGWYTDQALTKPYNFHAKEPVTQNLRLYAAWKNSTGPAFKEPVSMVYAAGFFYIADNNSERKAIFKVNPATGQREIFSVANADKQPETGNREVGTGPSLGNMIGMTLVGQTIYVLAAVDSVVAVRLDNGDRSVVPIGNNSTSGVDRDAEITRAKAITSNGIDRLYIADLLDQGIVQVNLQAQDSDKNATIYSSAKPGHSRGKTNNNASFAPDGHDAPHELAGGSALLYHNGILYAGVNSRKIATVAPNGDRDYLEGSLIDEFAWSIATDGMHLFVAELRGVISQRLIKGGSYIRQSVKATGAPEDRVSLTPFTNTIYYYADFANTLWILDHFQHALIRWSKPDSNRWTSTVWSKQQ